MTRPSTTGRTTRHPIQTAAMIVGAVFLLVGVLGFIPGVTTDYNTMSFAGHESDAKLLGIFQVSILHNLVHVLFGVWGLAAAKSFNGSRTFFLAGGVIYLVLFIYGLVIGHDTAANFVPVNSADNWLHLILALAMLAIGLLLGRRANTADTRTR
jgi:arginine exporter protein ArgO